MTMTPKFDHYIRNQIVDLCQTAGMNTARVEEIQNGCSLDRIRRILSHAISEISPGTLTFSSPDKLREAFDLALEVE
jgi:hypothetical protein